MLGIHITLLLTFKEVRGSDEDETEEDTFVTT